MMDPQDRASTPGELLTPGEREWALTLVRDAVESYVREARRLEPTAGSPLSSRTAAAFVTLTLRGSLRGCVGVLEPIGGLEVTLVHCAIAAATEDSRFPPVSTDELPHLLYEISILSPLSRACSAEEVEAGRHGVLIQAAGRQGLLLPQVAQEHRWDRRTFLQQVCRKAGLPKDAWKWSGSALWIFTAEVFGTPPR